MVASYNLFTSAFHMYVHTIVVFLSNMEVGMGTVKGFIRNHRPVSVNCFSHNLNGAPCISYTFVCNDDEGKRAKRGSEDREADSGTAKLKCPDRAKTELENKIYSALEKWRDKVSATGKVQKFMVAQNAELWSVAVFQPRSVEQLVMISGFAANKAEKYGAGILETVRPFLAPMGQEEVASMEWPTDEVMNSVWPDGNWTRPFAIRQEEEKKD